MPLRGLQTVEEPMPEDWRQKHGGVKEKQSQHTELNLVLPIASPKGLRPGSKEMSRGKLGCFPYVIFCLLYFSILESVIRSLLTGSKLSQMPCNRTVPLLVTVGLCFTRQLSQPRFIYHW